MTHGTEALSGFDPIGLVAWPPRSRIEAEMGSEPEPRSSIAVVYSDYDAVEGEKAIFGGAKRAVTKMGVLDTAALADSLDSFCSDLGVVFERIGTAIGRYDLESIDVTIEVTAKGEIRLVGSAGVEVRGGLKLTFARQSA